MQSLNILGLCGSLRECSTNMGLLRYAATLGDEKVKVEIADLTQIPFYNPDTKEKTAAVETLFDQAERADALILACPEYNYSVAPVLKNALDWMSREKGNPLLAGKAAAIVSSGGRFGAARAQYHLRQICVYLDLHLVNKPEVFCNAFAGGFNERGDLIDVVAQDLVGQQFQALLALADGLK